MRHLTVCGLVVLVAITGCHAPTPEPPGPPAADDLPSGEALALAANSRGFALDLYAQVAAARPGNVCVSPFSAHTALAMTAVGARGQTLAELRQALHLPADDGTGDARIRDLLAALTRAGPGRGYEILTANAIWAQTGYPWRPEFAQRLSQDLAAGLVSADFGRDPNAARLRINAWAEEQTRGKIKDLFAEGTITADHRVVLANALYFQGEWTVGFDPKRTRPGSFTRPDGTEVDIPMMAREGGVRLRIVPSKDEDEIRPEVSVADIPYKSGQVSMAVLLPGKLDGLSALEKKLTPELLTEWLAAAKDGGEKARLVLPKFRVEMGHDLKEPLKALGVRTAFDPNRADFSGTHTGPERLFVSLAVQKVAVEVNEEGTVAAAATGIGRQKKNGAPSFVADHPFLFLIRHVPTGAILFIGRYTGP